MAIIRSIVIGKGRKSLGDVTLKTMYGMTIASQKIVTNKSNTFAQQTRRSAFSRIVKTLTRVPLFSQIVRNLNQNDGFSSPLSVFIKNNYPALYAANTQIQTATATEDKANLPYGFKDLGPSSGYIAGVDDTINMAIMLNGPKTVRDSDPNAFAVDGATFTLSNAPEDIFTYETLGGPNVKEGAVAASIGCQFDGFDVTKLVLQYAILMDRKTPANYFSASNAMEYQFSGPTVVTNEGDLAEWLTIVRSSTDPNNNYFQCIPNATKTATNDFFVWLVYRYNDRLVRCQLPIGKCSKTIWGSQTAV